MDPGHQDKIKNHGMVLFPSFFDVLCVSGVPCIMAYCFPSIHWQGLGCGQSGLVVGAGAKVQGQKLSRV